MRKLATGSYNLHIEGTRLSCRFNLLAFILNYLSFLLGYSYAKSTNELQVFQSLDEAFCWMELIEPSPTNAADESSEN